MKSIVTGSLIAFSLALTGFTAGAMPASAQMTEKVVVGPGVMEYHSRTTIADAEAAAPVAIEAPLPAPPAPAAMPILRQSTEQITEREERHWTTPRTAIRTETMQIKRVSRAPVLRTRRVAMARPATRRRLIASRVKFVQKVVERPVFIEKTVERTIEKPVILERPVERVVEQPVYVDRVIEKPVYLDRVIEKPVVEERVIEKPVIQEKIIDRPVIIKEKAHHHLLHLGIL